MSNDDVFITSIHVKKVRNLANFDISLSEEKRQNLIITGKNGSGKTSLLSEIDKHIESLVNKKSIVGCYGGAPYGVLPFGAVTFSDVINNRIEIHFKNSSLLKENYLVVLFEAKRSNIPIIPKGIKKPELKAKYQSKDKINKNFIQFIVNLKFEGYVAKIENDNGLAKQIDDWFERFEKHLKDIFDAPDLRLIFDRQNYNFHIQIGNNEPFAFNELSDGYSAVISIVTELILRMETTGNKAYDQQGIVLIDEIETHLHVALQKKIMPFLCDFFPNVQFIVTTHSPFVLSSISNAVICDLETKEVITDLSGYSYTALVESYFDTDKYSQEIKNKIERFEELSTKEILNEQEEDEQDELKHYFNNLPKFYADELEVKLQQIRLQTMARKG